MYTAPAAFPTSDFASYHFKPSGQEAEYRPAITRVGGGAFPASLVNPSHEPTAVPSSEAVLPKPSGSAGGKGHKLRDQIVHQVTQILDNNSTSKCERCKKALPLGQRLARAEPDVVPEVLIELCKRYKYERYGKSPDVNATCERSYTAAAQGGVFTQMLSYADMSKGNKDVVNICSQVFRGVCDVPAPATLSDEYLNHWFKGQREAPAKVQQRTKKTGTKGDTLKVIWTSDAHVDGRYMVGSEAQCSGYMCCRTTAYNATRYNATKLPDHVPKGNISHPAGYWGEFTCDTPWSLLTSAYEAVAALGGKHGFDLGLYTGDVTAHDETWGYSRDYVQYSEASIYETMKRYTRNTTVVAAIGNHDSSVSEMAAQARLPDGRGNQYSWDWDNIAKLWRSEHWLGEQEEKMVSKHYGGYSIRPRKGLRVITLNTDFWYSGNGFAFIHTEDPDYSGSLRFVTDELQAAEDAHERVWIVGHVLSGWDGYSSIDAPTNLFYQIVSRYSHTIAAVFFGHTHEDQFSVFYRNSNGNSSSVSRRTADAVGVQFIGPSITPLKHVNPSVRVLHVDPETYDVMDFDQYYTPLQNVPHDSHRGLEWRHLYSARAAYSNFSASEHAGKYSGGVKLENGMWPQDAPLNATFWAALTDEMEQRPELVERFTQYQGRSSPYTPSCTGECAKAKVCYMRSGSYALGASCPKKFGSVQ